VVIVLAAAASVACSTETTTATLTDPPTVALRDAGGVPAAQGRAALDAVRSGNAQAVAAAPALVPPGAPLAPFIESRLYAIANVAMHDALNAIVPRFERYADTGPMDPDAAIAVAVLTAAHDAIVGADPASQAATDAWYAAAVAGQSGATGFAEGVALGERVAAAILARRTNDGTAGGGVAPYHPGSSAGDYQFTFPFNTPAFDFFGTGGFADASVWGSGVTPFVLQSSAQFRAPPQYENPREVGADRIVNAVAALEIYGGPLIIVDFGTATTFCAVTANAEYLGGVICPGIKISAEALFQK
jgi:hypothetical protein